MNWYAYCGNNSDTFDYTFGTGYTALDMGEPGKYMKIAHIASSSDNYSATVFLYYERYVSNDTNYIRIIKSNGYGTGTLGRIYVDEIKYTEYNRFARSISYNRNKC